MPTLLFPNPSLMERLPEMHDSEVVGLFSRPERRLQSVCGDIKYNHHDSLKTMIAYSCGLSEDYRPRELTSVDVERLRQLLVALHENAVNLLEYERQLRVERKTDATFEPHVGLVGAERMLESMDLGMTISIAFRRPPFTATFNHDQTESLAAARKECERIANRMYEAGVRPRPEIVTTGPDEYGYSVISVGGIPRFYVDHYNENGLR